MGEAALRRSEKRRGLGQRAELREPAMGMVDTPPVLLWVATVVAGLFVILCVLLLAVPWQQSAIGAGRVIAYSPAERQQIVDAPVKGRIAEWLVTEGQKVEIGDALVQIVDNDPSLLERLEAQRDAALAEIASLEDQIRSYTTKTQLLRSNVGVVRSAFDSKIAAKQRLRAGEAANFDAARRQLDRITTLSAEGITSQREVELATVKFQESSAKLRAIDAEIQAMGRERSKTATDVETKQASAQAEVEAAQSKLASARRKLLDAESKLNRQNSQRVVANRAGTVLMLHGDPGGGQVKPGDPLVTLVPETQSRAAEVWVDGNDMPFVEQGGAVRLVFEGWPALQVVGLPGASHGTFGGRVAFVDSTDDGTGSFRVVVVQDEDEPWPEPSRLRQGVRAKGWMMLGQVSLGYELWRQINGFPALPSKDKKKDKVSLPTFKKPRAPSSLK